jgi:hypothetical protein
MCGNEAMGEAAILAGVDAYFGYPITPQNEFTAYMAQRMPCCCNRQEGYDKLVKPGYKPDAGRDELFSRG